MTKEEFLKRVNLKFNGKYEYIDLPEKFGAYEKIKICCSKHGIFEYEAKSHYNGALCPKCLLEKKRGEFIDAAKRIYGNKYDYSKVEYKNKSENVCIICPEHGKFWVSPKNHLNGYGCPECKKLKNKPYMKYDLGYFIKRSTDVHGGKYDYSKVIYNGLTKEVCIICPEHGEFWQMARYHLNGAGCPKCVGRNKTTEEFIKQSKGVHGNKYDYSKVEYKNSQEKVCIICPTHGEFWQDPHNHLKGAGCPRCAGLLKTDDEFIARAKEVHGDRYDYSKVKYIDAKTKVSVICKKHGEFLVSPVNHIFCKSGCPKCVDNSSKWENEVYEFIKDYYNNAEQSNRHILNGKEIDIYIPELKLGIECDGLRWHNEQYKEKNYHLEKTKEAEKNGLRLIHIFEDEWHDKREICKSMLLNLFGFTKDVYYARKCEIREVSHADKRCFLNSNHLQGDTNSSINLGLYYGDDLVSLMCFSKPRLNVGGKKEDGSYELVRFCSLLNCNVIGGASKLLKYFIREYNPKLITTFSDNRWSIGDLYEKIGFKFDHVSAPNYFYVVGFTRQNRFKYRKSILIKEGYDSNKTEHEIMLDRGIYRIYDCGTRVYKLRQYD